MRKAALLLAEAFRSLCEERVPGRSRPRPPLALTPARDATGRFCAKPLGGARPIEGRRYLLDEARFL
jgi:hypothetical protein